MCGIIIVKDVVYISLRGVVGDQTKVILVRNWLICHTFSRSYSSRHWSNWSGVYPLARIRWRALSNLLERERERERDRERKGGMGGGGKRERVNSEKYGDCGHMIITRLSPDCLCLTYP